MSEKNIEDVKEQVIADTPPQNQEHCDESVEEMSGPDEKGENTMPSQQQEEEIIKKKYGGIVPKKPPLISKDHERAFFDSADWALGKQGAQKPKGPLEALRPKLQPTPHQQVRSRRSAYAPADEGEAGNDGNNIDPAAEDQQSTIESGHNDHVPEEKVCKE